MATWDAEVEQVRRYRSARRDVSRRPSALRGGMPRRNYRAASISPRSQHDVAQWHPAKRNFQ